MKLFRKLSPSIFMLVGRVSPLFFFLGYGLISPVSAAERLIVQIGPFQHTVTVDELERFAKTGELSPELKPYSFALTPQVKQILEQSFTVDPLIAEQFLVDLFKSGDGEKLLKQVSTAFPGSTPQQLKGALQLLLRQTNKLSFLNLLRVYPQETVAVDLSQAASLAIQLNASFVQSRLLTPRLEQALKSTPQTEVSFPFDPTVPGKNVVTMKTLVFRDRSRQRTIPIDIYYGTKTQGPLVVMSHGFAADRRFLGYLARHLASYGITVVSIEHPGSNINALANTATGLPFSQILPPAEFINRPQDVSFILTQLALLNTNTQDSLLKGKFNTEQVSMIGHSFGGYTAFALAGATLNLRDLRRFCQEKAPLGRSPADWLQCAAAELPYRQRRFKDNRIKQIIAFNPIIGELFGSNLSEVKIPTLILSSTDDGITPTIPNQLEPFKKLTGEKYLIVALGATHMSITDKENAKSDVAQSTLVREVMGIASEPVRQVVRGVSLAFIQQLTPQNSEYQPFLTPAYVESLSQAPIQFRFSTQLPLSLDTWLNVLTVGNPKITSDFLKPKTSSAMSQLKYHFIKARQKLLTPEYCTGQLDDLFTDLLLTYPQDFDDWS